MNQKHILLEHAGTPIDALPEEVKAKVIAHPKLRAALEQQADMARLMKLKNYETPDERMFDRVHHRVQIRVKHPASTVPEPYLDQLPSWARMVAVVVVMLGLSVLTHREMLRSPDEVEPGFAAPEAPAPQPFTPLFFQDSDPFVTYVFAPSLKPFDAAPVILTRQLEADFQSLGLMETNALESATLLPVMLPAAP